MATELVKDVDQITPAWLTLVLRRAGVLRDSEVTAIEKKCSRPFFSTVCHLNVTYSAQTQAPRRLLLKISHPDKEIPERGKKEIAFHRVLGAKHPLPIPLCYDAVFDEESGHSHLLLNDLSQTHFVLAEALPPTTAQSHQAIDGLAHIHAYWWGGDAFHTIPMTSSTEKLLQQAFAEDVDVFIQFVDFFGDRLSDRRRNIFEDVLRARPILDRHFLASDRLTLCHGDAHAWNFLYPNTENGRAVLLDWDRVHKSIGTDDLAFMMGLFWNAEHRGHYEKQLVRHYHTRLIENGVKHYTWDACWQDYRLSIMHNLFEPIWWWKLNHLPTIHWLTRLEHILCAFEDLDCVELLPG